MAIILISQINNGHYINPLIDAFLMGHEKALNLVVVNAILMSFNAHYFFHGADNIILINSIMAMNSSGHGFEFNWW